MTTKQAAAILDGIKVVSDSVEDSIINTALEMGINALKAMERWEREQLRELGYGEKK